MELWMWLAALVIGCFLLSLGVALRKIFRGIE